MGCYIWYNEEGLVGAAARPGPSSLYCGSILDKIYTNADKWYSKPIILPRVGKSDHNAVLLVPNSPVVNVKGAATPMPYVYRSYDSNGKTLLAHVSRILIGLSYIAWIAASTC